jgi:DNA replication protein DnaC
MVTAAQCPLCHGSGWKPVAPAVDPKSRSQSKEPRVTRCDCKLSERSERLLEQARIPARYQHCELASFHAEYGGPNAALSKAALTAGRFVEEYPLDKDKTGLLFMGPVGVGKTHLAVGILRGLILGKGVPCLFTDYRELLKEIQNSYNPSVSATEMSILRPVFEAEVLVLDELGAVKPTEWVWDTVSLVLNTRYNDMRTTIITTNLDDKPAAAAGRESFGREAAARAAREETLGDRIGERMRSRLHEMCRKVTLEGEDFRQKVRSASLR